MSFIFVLHITNVFYVLAEYTLRMCIIHAHRRGLGEHALSEVIRLFSEASTWSYSQFFKNYVKVGCIF